MKKGKAPLLVNYKNEGVRCVYDAYRKSFCGLLPNSKESVTIYR
jgi:hypothetical protein